MATSTGIELIDTIQNDLLKSAELTGQWEKKLRMIEDGTYEVADFMEELKVMVNELVHVVKCSPRKAITVEVVEEEKKESSTKEKAPRKEKKTPSEPVVLKCPKCGNGEIVKGRAAWGCSLYRKSCDFIIPMEFFGKKLTQKQVEALVLKSKTGVLNGFKNEDGSTFGGVLRLDDNFKVVVDRK